MKADVRHITQAEFYKARTLWDKCFPEDASGYSEYYFNRRTKAEYVIGIFDGDEMVSGLHMIPYPLHFGEGVKPCAMIAGVATLPQYRHQGLAAALINYAHDELRAKNICAALLKPDVDFYRQFGYVSFSWHDEYELAPEKSDGGLLLHEPGPYEMLNIYNEFAKDYTGMMVRSQGDMEAYLEEAKLSGFALSDGNTYALCMETKEGIEISELVGKAPVELAREISLGIKKVRFRLPRGTACALTPEGRLMFSMICPLNEEALLAGTGKKTLAELISDSARPCCTLEFC